METREIWVRIGVSLKGTKDEIEKVISGDTETLRSLLGSGNADGDSYIPACSVEEYNAIYGESHDETDINFNL